MKWKISSLLSALTLAFTLAMLPFSASFADDDDELGISGLSALDDSGSVDASLDEDSDDSESEDGDSEESDSTDSVDSVDDSDSEDSDGTLNDSDSEDDSEDDGDEGEDPSSED